MYANAKTTNQSVFDIARVGCKRLFYIVDPKTRVVTCHCDLLIAWKCKKTTCFLANCPIANEQMSMEVK
jgi:hypothetical protein